jgi:hypothetical protein
MHGASCTSAHSAILVPLPYSKILELGQRSRVWWRDELPPVWVSVFLKISKEPKRKKVGAMRITRLARSDCGLPLYSISLTTCVSDVMMHPALVVAIPCTHTACISELSELARVRVLHAQASQSRCDKMLSLQEATKRCRASVWVFPCRYILCLAH